MSATNQRSQMRSKMKIEVQPVFPSASRNGNAQLSYASGTMKSERQSWTRGSDSGRIFGSLKIPILV
eukprot:614248-Rhodomonas_salina.1